MAYFTALKTKAKEETSGKKVQIPASDAIKHVVEIDLLSLGKSD